MASTTRLQVTLAPGHNTIPHGLTNLVDPALIMVIPAVPLADWFNIDIIGQPTLTNVVLDNTSSQILVLNVVFEYAHTILGTIDTDPY